MSVGLIEAKPGPASATEIARSIEISEMIPVPKEEISVEGLSGQHDMPATLHVGFQAGAFAPAEPKPVTTVANTGRSFPLGATIAGDGVNFSVYSRQASRVEFLLFDDAAAAHQTRGIELDPRTHRTYHYWHVFVPGIGPGQIYAYRADGPFDPARGLRFDPARALFDPTATP